MVHNTLKVYVQGHITSEKFGEISENNTLETVQDRDIGLVAMQD